MTVRFTLHALSRMNQYEISKEIVDKTLKEPDNLLDGHSDRLIAQRRLNGKLLRVIFEKETI